MNISLKPRHAFIILAVIFLIALVIRLYPVIETPETANKGYGHFGDSYLYLVTAYNVYEGKGFSGTEDGRTFGLNAHAIKQEFDPEMTRGPVYPFFISMVYRCWGSGKDMLSVETWHKNWDKVRMVQCVLDASICILVFFISLAIIRGSFLPALLAAGIYCFSFYNIYYTRALLSESIATFLLTVSLLFCVLGKRYDRSYLWGLAGAFFGLIILTRPEYILFPAAFMFYMVIRESKDIVRAFKKYLIFVVAAILVVIPWTIRNYCVSKEFIPVAVGSIGVDMFFGTCEANDNWQGWGVLPNGQFDPAEKEAAQSLFTSFLTAERKGSIEAKDPDKVLMGLALKRIKKNPIECLKLWVLKMPRLWYQLYIPMYRQGEASGIYFIFYFIFAVIALWKSSKEEKDLMMPICLLFIYVNLIFLPLHIEPRYGVPLMPGIICLASIGVCKAAGGRYIAFTKAGSSPTPQKLA